MAVTALWLFLKSPLGRRLGGAVLLLVLIGGGLLYVYNKGKDAGNADGQRAQLEIDRQQFEQDRKQFLDTLKQYQEKDDAAKQAIAQKDSEIAALRQSRLAIHQTIASVPAEKLVGDIQSRLGDLPTQSFTEPQLRRVDETLADYQNIQKQLSALEGKVAAQDQRIDAISHQRDAAIESYNKLVPLYTKAYNAAQKRHSKFVKIITLGLVRDRKLDLPSPATLDAAKVP